MRKKKKVIISVLLVCLIILSILGYKYYKINKKIKQTGKPLTPVVDPKEDGVLNLSGFGIFFEQYNGELKTSQISYHLEDVTTKVLPEIFNEVKEYNDEELELYYEKNASLIEESFGIKQFDNFEKLISNLKTANQDLTTWYRLDIDKETFNNNSEKKNYAYIEYEVSFLNDEVIRFYLYVSKNSNTLPIYIIGVIE